MNANARLCAISALTNRVFWVTMYMYRFFRYGGTVIDVAPDGDLTVKLVQANAVSAKVVQERRIAFGEE